MITIKKTVVLETFEQLLAIPLFSLVPDEYLWYVAEKAKSMVLPYKKDFFQEEKTDVNAMYIIKNGSLAITKKGQKIGTLATHQFFGGLELILKREKSLCTISVDSRNGAELIRISKNTFKFLLESGNQFSIALNSHFAAVIVGYTYNLVKETERASDIDNILDRFNAVSRAILRTTGEETFEEKYLLKKNFKLLDLENKYVVKIESAKIEQAYLSSPEEKIERRIRKIQDSYFFTKKETSGNKAETIDQKIDKKQYLAYLKEAKGDIIKKTRYRVKGYKGGEIHIDVYDSATSLAPLAIAEITFLTLEDYENFQEPNWLKEFKKEKVTNNKAYKNKNLAFNGKP